MPDLVVLVVEARTESGLTVRSDEVLNVFHRSSGVIHPKQRKLRPEEKLILEYKYEEAYELLQQRLAKNPDDLDALWLLARFYYCGTRPLDESMGGYAHQDLNKCLETLQKIASIEPARSPRPSLWWRNSLSDLGIDARSKQKLRRTADFSCLFRLGVKIH